MYYLYYGNDKFLSMKTAHDKFTELSLAKATYDSRIINCEDEDLNSITRELETGSLFSRGKVLFLKRLSKSKEFSAEVEKFFKTVEEQVTKNPDMLELVIWEDLKIKSNSKYLKSISKSKNCYTSECYDIMNKRSLYAWISKYLKNKELILSSDELDLLLKRTNYEIERVINEIDKLSLLKSAGERVNIEIIKEIVPDSYESQVWDLIDAINARDKIQTLTIYENILKNGYDDYLILNSISRNLDQVIMVKALFEEGKNTSDIIKKIHIHPFVLSKLSGSIKNYEWNVIKKIYEKLNFLDAESKSGKIDIRLAMTILLGVL